tara:strand:+ start:29715 stop:30047 length:333 start_codon:yes stop_codon:yes gene_type:complete
VTLPQENVYLAHNSYETLIVKHKTVNSPVFHVQASFVRLTVTVHKDKAALVASVSEAPSPHIAVTKPDAQPNKLATTKMVLLVSAQVSVDVKRTKIVAKLPADKAGRRVL